MKSKEQLRREAESAFEEVLADISGEYRDPTRWEAECLSGALIMMAIADYAAANEMLESSQCISLDRYVGPQSTMTVDYLRASFAMVKNSC